MQPAPCLFERVEQAALDPAVEQRVGRLVDEERRPEVAQDGRRLARLLRRVGGDAGVERLPLAHGRVERAHRLLERRLRVEAMGVEDVDVVEPHSPQALVEAREQVLARAPFAVGAGPHVVAGLGRDDQLVAVGPEVLRQEPAEVLLGGAVGRAVVVGQVEMRDAEVERAAQDRAARLERTVAAEVVPEPERDARGAAGRSVRSGGRASGRSAPRRQRRSSGSKTSCDAGDRTLSSAVERQALRHPSKGGDMSTVSEILGDKERADIRLRPSAGLPRTPTRPRRSGGPAPLVTEDLQHVAHDASFGRVAERLPPSGGR